MIYDKIHSIQKIVVSTKKHCELPDLGRYHRYHKNIRYHRYHKKWNTSHEKGTISKRRVRLVSKHLHVKVIKLFQPWGDRLWQFWKHPLCHLGEKMNEKQNLFGQILWFCEALIVQHIFYFGPGECCPQRESAIFAPFLPLTQAFWARNRKLWRGSDSQPHYSSKFWPKEHNLADTDLLMCRKSSANVSILEMPV